MSLEQEDRLHVVAMVDARRTIANDPRTHSSEAKYLAREAGILDALLASDVVARGVEREVARELGPDVSIVALEPERPTLEQVLAEHKPIVSHAAEMSSGCACEETWTPGERSWFDHVASALRESGLVR